jgi:hypothetical protein
MNSFCEQAVAPSHCTFIDLLLEQSGFGLPNDLNDDCRRLTTYGTRD